MSQFKQKNSLKSSKKTLKKEIKLRILKSFTEKLALYR
jgi:hypothetical protein